MIKSERELAPVGQGGQDPSVCGCGRHREFAWNHVIHVCSSCGRASNAQGEWVPAGSFISEHPDLTVEYVELLCLDCRDRYFWRR